MNPDLNTIRAVRELFEDPNRWCRYYEALDDNYEETQPTNPNAVRWCFYGALSKFGASRATYDYLVEASYRLYGHHPILVNDTYGGYEGIVKLLDYSIGAYDHENSHPSPSRHPLRDLRCHSPHP